MNVATRSGTNVFHGSVFGYFRPRALESERTQVERVNGAVNVTGTDSKDFGTTLGGPLRKDRLFLFAAFNPQFQRRTFIAPEGFPLRRLGEVDQKQHVLSYAGMATGVRGWGRSTT